MCYDISYLTNRQIDYAKRYGTSEDVDEVIKRLPPVFHTSGFEHALAPVVVQEDRYRLKLFEWGLIPFWTKNAADATSISNKTLNARGETIFEKPSFRHAAEEQRCLVLVDGFFEYHHHKGKSYPYFISRKDDEPFALGGVWDEWNDKELGVVRYSFSIITTDANPRMAEIHNNPLVLKRGGPRMPFIVPEDLQDEWMDFQLEKEDVKNLIKPFSEGELKDHTVAPLRGKLASGNTEDAIEPFRYAELEAGDQASLF